MNEYAEWIAALEHRRRGKTFLCPSHEDASPSLSITEGADGRVLVHCFAGCTFEAIRDALGIPARAPDGVAAQQVRNPPPAPPKRAVALPEGAQTWFYTDAGGRRVLAVTRHESATGKRFAQWTPAPDGGWYAQGLSGKRPLYRLPALLASTGRVAIVEGEKCADAVSAAWPSQTITTWAGGAAAWAKTDWQPLRGREVSLIADADEAGHKAMRGIAVILAELGCAVRLALPPLEWHSDIADWLADVGPADTAALVREMLTDFEPPATEPPPAAAPDTDAIRDNPHYSIIGLDGSSIAIRLKAAGQIIRRTREQMVQPSTLIAMAPESWWCSLTGAPELATRTSRSIGDSLIRAADSMGQIDLNSIWGRGAVRMADGVVAYHLGDRVLISGEERGLDMPGVHWLAEPPIVLSGSASDAQMRALGEALLQYRWADAQSARRIIGWIAASIMGGALQWRPHILFVAPHKSGKSWILEQVMSRIMGSLALVTADATPAGIARLMAHTSLPLIIDEAEPTGGWIQHLLALLRVSAGGFGTRVRAEQGGDGIRRQEQRFAALLSATAAPRLSRADESRMSPVSLGGVVDDWPAVRAAIVESLAASDAIRSRLVRVTAETVAEADRLGAEYQDLGMDSREALASASLTAGWRAWCVDDLDVYATDKRDDESESTGGDLLNDVLAYRHRRDGEDMDLLTLLSRDEGKAATLYGLRRSGASLLIAPTHSGLIGALSRGAHGSTDLRSVLLQIEGAELTNPLAFGSRRLRAIEIPGAALAALGVDIWGGE